jgi:hypothetical protein
VNRVTTVLAAALVIVGLAACASPAPPAVTETQTVTVTPSPAPSEVMPAGTCTGDPDSDAAVTYTVWADNTTVPVEIAYTEFNADGTTPVVTEAVTGPIAVRLGHVCNAETSGDVWTFTASTTTGGALSCVLAFGGKTVSSKSAFDERSDATVSVDCSGNPGR